MDTRFVAFQTTAGRTVYFAPAHVTSILDDGDVERFDGGELTKKPTSVVCTAESGGGLTVFGSPRSIAARLAGEFD